MRSGWVGIIKGLLALSVIFSKFSAVINIFGLLITGRKVALPSFFPILL
jgi:hypothetical protein